jgi:hypothetical protein
MLIAESFFQPLGEKVREGVGIRKPQARKPSQLALISQPFRGEGRVFYQINETPTFSPKRLGFFIVISHREHGAAEPQPKG